MVSEIAALAMKLLWKWTHTHTLYTHIKAQLHCIFEKKKLEQNKWLQLWLERKCPKGSKTPWRHLDVPKRSTPVFFLATGVTFQSSLWENPYTFLSFLESIIIPSVFQVEETALSSKKTYRILGRTGHWPTTLLSLLTYITATNQNCNFESFLGHTANINLYRFAVQIK